MINKMKISLVFMLLLGLLPNSVVNSQVLPKEEMTQNNKTFTVSFGFWEQHDMFDYMYDYAFDALDATNELRAKVGVAPLQMDSSLLEMAMIRSIETKILFEHERPNGKNIWTIGEEVQSPKISFDAENIIVGNYEDGSDVVNKGWNESPSHRAAMIDEKYKSIGIGFSSAIFTGVQLFSEELGSVVVREDYPAREAIRRSIEVKNDYIILSVAHSKIKVGESLTLDVFSEALNRKRLPSYYPMDMDQFEISASNSNVNLVNNVIQGKREGSVELTIKHIPSGIAITTGFIVSKMELSCPSTDGWNNSEHGWYYCEGGDALQNANKWKKINNHWYFFDVRAIMISDTWKKSGTSWYYLGTNGSAYKSSLSTINGKQYLFDSNSIMQTGWHVINNTWHYFETSGALVTGDWIKGNSTWYYANENGVLAKNEWIKDNNKWYYFGNSTKMVKGWSLINNRWYHMNGSGVMTSSKWLTSGSDWYYMQAGGAASKNKWELISGSWYRFDTNSKMIRGWNSINSKWYYHDQNGKMVESAWRSIGSKWYYFNSAGVMSTGWFKVNGEWYYSNGSGVAQTGWLRSSGNWFYLESSLKMASSIYRDIGNTRYFFNPSGHMMSSHPLSLGSQKPIDYPYVNYSAKWRPFKKDTAPKGVKEQPGYEYRNCTELRKVYPNGVYYGHPAYDSTRYLDRDFDGAACESDWNKGASY